MNDVAVTSKALERAMLTGSPEPTKGLTRFLIGRKGTGNQKIMAAAAGCFAEPGVIHEAALALALEMLAREEAEGPWPWEMGCPDAHEGMWIFGHLGILAAGLAKHRDLVNAAERPPASAPPLARAAWSAGHILGQVLRIADLVATPDGECIGLPGMRAPQGAQMSRRALTGFWKEVRGRQGVDVIHRGTGGGKRIIRRWDKDSDPLFDGPLWWARLLLDGPAGAALLSGHWSRAAALPAQLRLQLTVERWAGGTLAWYADPGPEGRAHFLVHGSAAARRYHGPEKPVDWIRVEWGASGKHRVIVSQAWELPRPASPGGERTVISGIVGSSGEPHADPGDGDGEPSVNPPSNVSPEILRAADLLEGLTLPRREQGRQAAIVMALRKGDDPGIFLPVIKAWFRDDSPQAQAAQWREAIGIIEDLG